MSVDMSLVESEASKIALYFLLVDTNLKID